MHSITIEVIFILFSFDCFVNGAFKENCKCRSSASNRIVGGQITARNELSWLVSMQEKDFEPVCITN